MLALAGCSGGLGRPSDLKVNETDWVLSWSPVENATASTTYIVEIDGRPSDTFALAMRANAPILIDSAVLENLPDMSEALKKLRGEV